MPHVQIAWTALLVWASVACRVPREHEDVPRAAPQPTVASSGQKPAPAADSRGPNDSNGEGDGSRPAAPSASWQTPELSAQPWPRTCDEAIARLLAELDEPSKARLRAAPRTDLALLHHSWGAALRNRFGMWGGNDVLVSSCVAGRPGTETHPDEASRIIIEAVWTSLHPGE